MTTPATRFLTVAALTNPLLWLVVALGVMLAAVGLGVLVLYGIYRYLRAEWTIPTRPKLVPGTELEPPVFGVELPRPGRLTEERRVEVLATERGEPASCAQDEAPKLVRTRSKPRKPAATPKVTKKSPAPPAKARTKAKPAKKATPKAKKTTK